MQHAQTIHANAASVTIDVSTAPPGMTHVAIFWIGCLPSSGAAAWSIDVDQGGTVYFEGGGQHNTTFFHFGAAPIICPISAGDIVIGQDTGTNNATSVGYRYI
jgi:hypothetical protein